MAKYKIYNEYTGKEEIISTRFSKRELAFLRYAIELAQCDRPDQVQPEIEVIMAKLEIRIDDYDYISKVFLEIG